jgi:YD repeat-containing protein
VPIGLHQTRIWDEAFDTVPKENIDSGITNRQFDAANHLIGSSDAKGNQAAYAFDAAGRIQKQTITAAGQTQGNAKITTTQWTYQGHRLVALDHPTQSERYQYDARGLRTKRIVSLGNQPALTSVTHFEYDAEGQLLTSTLPDGSRLRYGRNGQGQVVALERQRVQTPWLRALEKPQIVASEFERDLVGPKRFVSGNGIEARFVRSREGALAQVVYRHTQPRASLQARAASGPAGILMGRTTQESIERLLGIAPAIAANPTASASPAPKSSKPGALSLPTDPQSLIDHRYLWDTAGNLLFDISQPGANPGAQGRLNHVYDNRNRLLASVKTALPVEDGAPEGKKTGAAEQAVWRYAYDNQSRRVLAQYGAPQQADFLTGTQRRRLESALNRN